MIAISTWNRNSIRRELAEPISALDRFVDAGVVLRVVAGDPNGSELLPGKPKLKELRRHTLGGIIDTAAIPPYICDTSKAPVEWLCSEEQEQALLYRDETKLGQLIYGSEGAGKTRLLAMWHYVQWIRHIGEDREGGQTAPTIARLAMVRQEMLSLYPPAWYGGKYRAADERFAMCDGTRIQLVSTYRQSKAQGSPIQGFNWSWCGRDEAQDSVDVHEDIESRGRSAADGLYWQMATATAKDDSTWRELRDVLEASGQWLIRSLSIFRSPFVDARFIATKRATMSPREFLRRYGDPKTGLVGDLQPELAVYYGWLRTRNLTHRPRIASDVTASILADYRSYLRPGAGLTLLCGHDPGVIYNTTEIMRLVMFGSVPVWVVVGEVQTEQTTAREHGSALKKKLQDDFGVDWDPSQHTPNPSGGKALIFCDPHGKGEAQTDYQSVYMAFQSVGLDVFSPSPMDGRIKRAARIEMINRLLGGSMDAQGVPRLVIATDDQGRPLAPKLVESLEVLRKKPGDSNPEGSRAKDSADRTHAPAALAYALWPFEQEASTTRTISRALAAAQRGV